MGAEQLFSIMMIKRAFWETFHKSGELWFDYLGSEEENQRSTEGKWGEFSDALAKICEQIDQSAEG